VWAQELDLMAEQLTAGVNAALGSEAIRELRCPHRLTSDPVFPPISRDLASF